MARPLHRKASLAWRRASARLPEVFEMALGLVVVGLGDVGSSILAGVEAARAHLVHPWGSLVEAGGAGRKPEHGGSQPLRLTAPFANLSDLALGAFELREDDAYRAALRAGHLSRSLLDE